jgi:hypothetical protein
MGWGSLTTDDDVDNGLSALIAAASRPLSPFPDEDTEIPSFGEFQNEYAKPLKRRTPNTKYDEMLRLIRHQMDSMERQMGLLKQQTQLLEILIRDEGEDDDLDE